MKTTSVITESEELKLSVKLIKLGARLQLLESQTSISREKLIKLYKEIKGVSPSKGMLPYSSEWFLTWQPNVHSSIFINIYIYLVNNVGMKGLDAIMKAYELYQQQVGNVVDAGTEQILSFTRAWTLTRFFESKLLSLKACNACSGKFVVDHYDLNPKFLCSLCNVPSRAGKTRKSTLANLEGITRTA